MADFAYTIGVEVDSSGIDSFIAKVRGLAKNTNFGTSFQLPHGVNASGPGISGNTANFTSPAQALGFAQSVGPALTAQIAAQRTAGTISPDEARVAQREIRSISSALLAGAHKFQEVISKVKGPVTETHLQDANRQARVAIDKDLAASEKREIKNAKRREAYAAERAARQAEKDVASTSTEADKEARRQKTQAHRRQATAAKKAADEEESEAHRIAVENAQAKGARRDKSGRFVAGGGGLGGLPPVPPTGGGRPSDGGDDEEGSRDRLIQAEARSIRKKEFEALQKRLLILRQQTVYDEEIAKTKAQILVAEQQQARAEREQAKTVLLQAREEGFFNVGTRTQRVQAAIHSKDGQLSDPLQEKTFGGLLSQRTLQASSFAVGGLVFYGALQVFRDTLKESEALERQFAVVKGQLDRTFGDDSTSAMQRFKASVREISLATGQLGSEVALVQRQLEAALVPTQANEGEDPAAFRKRQLAREGLAERNTEQAFKFAEVTGLSSTEIVDSLTAIGLSFKELDGNFAPILDRAIALEEEFGVLGGQIVTFTADLAPLGAQLGFSAQQLEELGASAQKFSGRSGGQLAEQFGRIFTDLPTKAADLIGLFSQTPELSDLASGLADAFVSDNMEQVLELILAAAARIQSQGLDPGLTQKISDTVAGRREGASFAAILREPQQLLEALKDPNDAAAGAVEERWKRVRDSLQETMERLRRAVEQLAEAILSAGLVDVLTTVAGLFTIVATAAEKVIRVFDFFNDATGGLVGQLAALYFSLRTIDFMLKTLGKSRAIGLIFPGIAGALSDVTAGSAARGLAATPGRLLGNLAVPEGAVAGAFAGDAARKGLVSRAAEGVGARAAGFAAGGRFLQFAGGGASFAGLAAPAAALIAVNELRNQRNDIAKGLESQGDALKLLIQKASTKDLFSQNPDTDTRVFGLPGTQGLGRGLLKGPIPEDVYFEGVAKKYGAGGLSAGLGVIGKGKDLGDILEINPGEYVNKEDYQKAIAEVEKALLGEDADLESVADFVTGVGEENPKLAAAMAAAADKATELKTAADSVASGESTASLDLLTKGLQANQATPAAVEAALKVALEPLQKMLKAATDAGDATAMLANAQAIADLQKQTNAAISQYYAEQISFGDRIRGIFGDSSPRTQAAAARRILKDTRITDPDVRLQALQDLQSARDAAFQAQLDAAETDGERIRLLNRGPGVDPLAQSEAIYLQAQQAIDTRVAQLRESTAHQKAFNADGVQGPALDGGDFSSQVDSLEGLTRDAIENLGNQVVKDVAEFGEGALKIRIFLLKTRREELLAAIRAISHYGFTTLAGYGMIAEVGEINKQIAGYEALDAQGFDPVLDDGGPNDAQKQQSKDLQKQQAEAIRQAQWELRAAYAAGDPVAEANVAVAHAQDDISHAKEAADKIQAQAALVAALKQQDEAFQDIGRAQLELQTARGEEDPKFAAGAALIAADQAVKHAKGTAERLRAQAERVRADRAFRDAIRDIADSQIELAIAYAESAGDTIEVAKLQLKQALTDLARERKTGDEAGINRAKGDVVNAQRALSDSILDKSQGDIDFALQMENISTSQAITAYQQLLTIPTNTEEQNRELMLTIKRLQGELGQDFQYNLPSQLGLPTLYEARRLDQSGGTGVGYQDNRQINVQVFADTNASAEDIGVAVAAAVGEPNRIGTYPGRY